MTSAHVSTDNSRGGDPSMEEILASIRRIIADEQAQTAQPAPEPAPVAVVQPFRPELRPVPKVPIVNAPAVQEFDAWLASNANASAVLRPSLSAVETRTEMSPDPVSPPAAAPDQQAAYHESFGQAEPDPIPQPSTWLADATPSPDYVHIQPAASAYQPAQADNDAYSSPVAPVEASQTTFAAEYDQGRTLQHQPQGEPLTSPATGLSVQASLQALAQTMFVQEQGLIGDSVREMLRPMLKQWLDDNLPLMVEKLVRAEIERVARGGR